MPLKILLALWTAVVLTACSKDATLEIVNRTSHDVYVTVRDQPYVIHGDSLGATKLSLDFNVEGDLNFLKDNTRDIRLSNFEGETFAIGVVNDELVTATTVELSAGKTYKIYCDPKYACLRLKNNGSRNIAQVTYDIYASGGSITHGPNNLLSEVVAPGDSTYFRLSPAGAGNNFSYRLKVITDDGTAYIKDVTLHNDDLFYWGINSR